MAANPNDAQNVKSQQIKLQKLLAAKQLRYWTSSDVILWLQLVNDGLFSKYTDIFQTTQINGKTLMTLDNEKTATELLGTQHQINTFVQSIKQLKAKNGRKMSIHRRRQSRRGQSLMGIDNSALFQINKHMKSKSTRDLTPRASTPTNNKSSKFKFRSRASSSQQDQQFTSNNQNIVRSATPTCTSKSYTSNGFPNFSPRSPTDMSLRNEQFIRQRSLSHGDADDEPTDKKVLWKLYKDRQNYSAILAKRGKFNTSFKKRWLVLCEVNEKKIKPLRPTSNSLVYGSAQSVGYNEEYESKCGHKMITKSTTFSSLGSVKNKSKGYGNSFHGYLFYFNERPIKDNDFPKGFINLNTVECVIGLMDENNNNSKDIGKDTVQYLKKKMKHSEYYEIILKTTDREWIFGALDTSSYVEWLIRLKKFEHK